MHHPLPEADDSSSDPRRLEAFHRYEQCLADGRTVVMESFVEQLLIQSPPPLELLQDIVGDLQNHLLTLRQQHFAMRERIIGAMQNIYHVDITPLTPTNRWHDYHLLDIERVLTMVHQGGFHLCREEADILRDMLESSTQICGRLSEDIALTEQLCGMIQDWLVAYLPLQTASDAGSDRRVH